MAAVVLSEELGRLAASLAGWRSARVAQDDVVWKPPGSGPVAFHQDSAYISRQFVPVKDRLITFLALLPALLRSAACCLYASIFYFIFVKQREFVTSWCCLNGDLCCVSHQHNQRES